MNIPDKCTKILGITADNASSNDTMVECLSELAPYFDGETSRVQCVLHVTNLVVKSLIKLFNIPKKGGQANDKTETGWDEELETRWDDKIETGSQDSSLESDRLEEIEQSMGDDEDEDDNVEGWVDETDSMTDNEHAALTRHIRPLWMILVKVSNNKKETKTYH